MSKQTTLETTQFLGIYRLVSRLHSESSWTESDKEAVQLHFKRLESCAKAGKVIIAGRTLEDYQKTFGIVVFEAADIEEARQFIESDPTVVAGVMTYELHPYRVAVLRNGI